MSVMSRRVRRKLVPPSLARVRMRRLLKIRQEFARMKDHRVGMSG